jgi:uncharacterized protein YceH (UPF0502 family)
LASRKQPSFLEISEEHHGKLLAYVERLRMAGLKLPGRQGKVNKTAVARACGFARETFQQNPRFAATLMAAVEELGIETPTTEDAPARNTEERARIFQLEQQLSAMRSENYELRRRLRKYEAVAEHMTATGRRVIE